MSYDKNGNMIKDLDREFVTIRYNILNLPDTVQFKNGNQIINRYTADGRKLSTVYFTRVTAITSPIIPGKVCNWTHTPGTVIKSGKDIVTNLEYKLTGNTRSLSKVFNSEGYAESITSNSYYYYRKDHLGSHRVLWHATSDYTCNITQYFPSGLAWAEGLTTYAMPDKFNGKEFVEMHGFDTYDYGARGYYAAIGRFTTIDPLAEKDYSISPYAYCDNNPVNRIDPDGREDLSTLCYDLPEFTVTAISGKGTKSWADGAWYDLLFGHGKNEEGGDWFSNNSESVPIKKPIKGDDSGGTAGVMEAGGEPSYTPPPRDLPGFPGAVRVKPKGGRPRWKLPDGDIGEWDGQHGEVEKYNPRGKHKGAWDPGGNQIKDPVPGRQIDPSLRDKIGQAVGLSGAALTLYLIISEGSRLFPPRNLIPIP